MDKIEKALVKLTEKERRRMKQVLVRLERGDVGGLNIKKLKGRNDIFRVRKGDIRIIYRFSGKAIFIMAIERRREDTYKF